MSRTWQKWWDVISKISYKKAVASILDACFCFLLEHSLWRTPAVTSGCGPVEQPHGQSPWPVKTRWEILKAGFPVKPSEKAAQPAHSVTASSWETLARGLQLSESDSDPRKLQGNKCVLFEAGNFGVICYTAVDNTNGFAIKSSLNPLHSHVLSTQRRWRPFPLWIFSCFCLPHGCK